MIKNSHEGLFLFCIVWKAYPSAIFSPFFVFLRFIYTMKTSTPLPNASEKSSKPLSKPRILFGFLFIIISLMMTLSFGSYLLNWKSDQSQAGTMLDRTVVSNNLFGKLGDWLGKIFIFDSIGIAAFIVAFWVFVLGLLILKKRYFKPWKTLGHSLFFVCWLPIFLGAITMGEGTLSGVYGFQIVDFLRSVIGIAGLWLIIVSGIALYFILEFNVRPSALKKRFSDTQLLPKKKLNSILPKSQEKFEADKNLSSNESEEEEEILPEPVSLSSKDAPIEVVKTTPNTPIENIPIHIETHSEKAIKQATDNEVKKNNEVILESTSLDTPVEKSDDFELKISIMPTVDEETITETKSTELVKEFGLYDHTLDLAKFQLPPIEILKDYGNEEISVNNEELQENKNRIVGLLKNFNIGIAQIRATIGPTVTLYEIVPEAGIRVASIKKLQDDIALNLSALGIRIIAPMPGKGTIGIEVPRKNPTMVSMRSLIASQKFQNTDMDLPIVFGKTISNEIFMADLTKMPHLLMAGATGQGKSVGINAILTSLLYKKHPSEVKFVMVDPKKVELSLYSKIERHYLAKLPDSEDAILTDNSKVINTLNSLCLEMDMRYELLKQAFCRNIKEYNQKFKERKLNPENGHRYLPYIVLVVDEFADLIMTAGKEVEHPIARLAQLARAIGIHLIVATQRPSVNVITGMIKANFPARISFRVNASVDSRTILDSTGAEQLVGKGDMLYSNGNDLTRIQCAFVDTPEVEHIVDFIGEQKGYSSAMFLPEVQNEDSSGIGAFDPNEKDALFEEAARIVVGLQQGSTSNLQRQLKLGYNRAGRIMDQLEASGIVGSFNGAKAREVLITDLHALEEFLANMK